MINMPLLHKNILHAEKRSWCIRISFGIKFQHMLLSLCVPMNALTSGINQIMNQKMKNYISLTTISHILALNNISF